MGNRDDYNAKIGVIEAIPEKEARSPSMPVDVYVQEAEEAFKVIGNQAEWHLIGHLQSNKAKKAVRIFDAIETVDSVKLAKAIDKECKKTNKSMKIFIEINHHLFL